MEKYKISIIVPVYNAEDYIKECLDSIVNQTYKNLEILLIDDGSKDKSGLICNEYAKNDKRIKVIHQENSGVSVARNHGLDNCTGDYVMFVDADDWIELNACEILLKAITKENKDLIIYNYYKEKGKSSEKNINFICKKGNLSLTEYQAKILAPTIRINGVTCNSISLACNKIISAKFLKKHRFPFERQKAVFEDGIFYYLLFEKNIKIGIINEYLYHYRLISSSATHAYNASISQINDTIIDIIESVRDNHKADSLYKESLAIRKLINLMYILNLNINSDKNKVNLYKRVKALKIEANREQYSNIYSYIHTNNLNKKLKIYYLLLKYRLYLLVIIINKTERKLKEIIYLNK